VFVADEGRARWREVRLGMRGREMVEVVEGLSAGDRLVWPASAERSLNDGRRVKAP